MPRALLLPFPEIKFWSRFENLKKVDVGQEEIFNEHLKLIILKGGQRIFENLYEVRKNIKFDGILS